MKEVHVRAWCDACAGDIIREGDVEPATVEVVVTIAPGGPRLLDLCERHDKTLVEPLRALLVDAGQDPPTRAQRPAKTSTGDGRPGTRPRHPDRFPCLWCGLAYGSSGGIKDHAQREHGIKDGSSLAMFGTVCPLCQYAASGGPAMGVHARGEHAAPSVASLFRMAEDEGDPHGIVAARRKRGRPRNVTR